MLVVLATCFLLQDTTAFPLLSRLADDHSIGNSTVAASNASATSSNWWHGNPTTRGTLDLLISCFSTLFLAAWTSYHPNIPSSDSVFAMTIVRLKWVLLAAFMPEIVFWRALAQVWEARRLKMQIEKLGKQSFAGRTGDNDAQSIRKLQEQRPTKTWHDSSKEVTVTVTGTSDDAARNKDSAPSTWSLKEALFAVSGGIAVKSSTWHHCDKIFFTPKGVLQLARAGLLPVISKEEIEDKSKASTFTKIVACGQASWFAVQLVARLAQSLPVSLLEIHTLVHVFCALAIYGMWWEKAYDISKPLYSDDERVIDMAAFFALEGRGAHPTNDESLDKDWTDGDAQKCELWMCTHRSEVMLEHAIDAHADPMNTHHLWCKVKYVARRIFLRKKQKRDVKVEAAKEQVLRAKRAILRLRNRNMHIYWRDSKAGMSRLCWNEKGILFNEGPYATSDVGNSAIRGYLDQNDLHSNTYWHPYHGKLPSRLMRGERATTRFNSTATLDVHGSDPEPLDFSEGVELRNLTQHADPMQRIGRPDIDKHNLERFGYRKKDLDIDFPGKLEQAFRTYKLKPVVIGFFTAVYGGAHLAAWTLDFPTVIEMWLWRGAGISLVAGPCFAMLTAALWPVVRTLRKSAQDSEYALARALWWLAYAPVGFLWFMGASVLLLNVWCFPWIRLFLLAESLAALRAVAPGLYDVPLWAAYLPHFS